MKVMTAYCKNIGARLLCVVALSVLVCPKISPQQITIPRIEQMPNIPQPYFMRNWKSVAKGYDSLVFNINATGEYFPLSSLYANTVNYPASPSFRMKSYVGSSALGGEGINCLPAVIGAELVGIDKKNQNGIDWVTMCREWFNTLPAESIYLNNPRTSSGNDWWYETMPNIFFMQLYDLHPEISGFNVQCVTAANRWLKAASVMGGSTVPWNVPSMNHRAWKFSTMTPNDVGVREPEAAGAVAWYLYQAFVKTGDVKYRIGAEWCMEFLNSLSSNPSYELQLVYGTVAAARMNAEMGTTYDVNKMFNWCFDVGPLRNWGTTTGTWGIFDVSGLVGEVQQFQPGYAFLMNTMQHIAVLTPVARYDDRYARAIGKWVLNAANASRLFYSNALSDANQDGEVWSKANDLGSVIGYEAIRQTQNTVSPFATGDAVKNGWAATNFSLYGSSHVGYLASVVETTNVLKVLKLDLLKSDFGHAPAYPSFLFFNPYDSTVFVSIDVGNTPADLYDAASNNFIKNNISHETLFAIPANSARVVVIVPSGGVVTYSDEKMFINGIIVDYHSAQSIGNHRPRIKSFAADRDTVIVNNYAEVFCTAGDRDDDTLSFQWSSAHGSLSGIGSEMTWKAPDTTGIYDIVCTVTDSKSGPVTDTLKLTVVTGINHVPSIDKILANPRKLDLNSVSTVKCFASDIDGDSLTYSWSASGGEVNGSTESIFFTSPGTEGNYYVYCTVKDGHGGIAKESLSVEVRDYLKYSKGNLLAFYPLNGNANDSSGNGRNGVQENTAYVPDRQGKPYSAILFNGISSSILIPNDIGLNNQNAIGINFWMKIGSFYEREQYPISHGNYSNRWKVSISNKRLRWTIKTTAGIKDLDSDSELLADMQYNVSVQYNGSEMEIFLNGELEAFVPWTGAIQQTGIDMTFGKVLPNDNNYNFNGVLDDIRLFDYALSMNEITSFSSPVTSVKNVSSDTFPQRSLLDAYPNPFNPSTMIRFSLPVSGNVSIRIYDMLGRHISDIADGYYNGGIFERRWDAEKIASGIYLCVMKTQGHSILKKLILMR